MSDKGSALQSFHAKGDKIMSWVMSLLFIMALGLATLHQTWGAAWLVGLPTLMITIACYSVFPGAMLTRIVISAAFMVFSGLHIHQAHGMIEMHFGIFVLLAFLLYYRDWTVIVIAAGVIAVHHFVFYYLQASGLPVYVFDHDMGYSLVFIHAAYVVFQSGLLVYMAIQGSKEAILGFELMDISENFALKNGVINLANSEMQTNSAFARDYNVFMTTVSQTISKCQQITDYLSGALQKWQALNHETKELASRERQNTHNIASAVNQIATSLKDVANHSDEAADAAKQADELVETGSMVVNQTITALTKLAANVDDASTVIHKLEAHSNEIGTVLSVIKSIADQTNLLALNAAIEAARAGEQGRGFAVVADEVRTLASRTQKSTEDIQQMIESLQSQAKSAVKVMSEGGTQAQHDVEQASETSKAFKSIAHSVGVISNMNAQIADASKKQTVVANDILDNINEIVSIANETSLDVNSMDKMCGELIELTTQLKNLVNKFSV